ncbi:TetR family transcriptional regulator [Streptomyces spongiicola]|uniref:TetR family transcriptional regulator n=1 Tax=Streptomyces spongiicola TaxID=1690221 RepID=A0A2S1Z730_9ACTN|nr:TetR/AcrR family transcriptional regulator [Streptomyces spongiicola]AWK12167.1 TetR family transcriptional regulator [Streptomyces spongiicola]GBQ02235.1 TetR family transcriptional regulator [Streptomyces spongiicola]
MQDDRKPGPTPRRGRPRSFDLDAATASALSALWTRGYEATTVEDLVRATGLAPSSLYAAFGSKRGVLEAALARYDRDREDLLAPLERGEAGLEDLRLFFATVRTGLTRPGAPGCFMVNTATEVAPRDERIAVHANRYRERVRDGIAAALTRAAALGEVAPAGAEELLGRARVVQAALFGVQVAARSGAVHEALATLGALESQVSRWAPLSAASPGGDGRP